MSNNGNAILFRVGLDLKSISKDGAAMEKGVSASTQRAAATSSRLAKQMVRDAEKATAEIESIFKKAMQKREEVTKEAYTRMDRNAELRRRSVTSGLRREGIAGAAGGGGHGGGGMAGAGGARVVGDILDQLTGTRGNVMRANVAAHLPGLIPPLLLAMLAAKGASDQSALAGQSDKLASLIGQGSSPIGDRFKPLAFRQGATAGLADAQSEDEQRSRREAIQKQIEETRKGRTFLGSSFGEAALPGQTDRSFRLEIAAQEKLMEIDATMAGRVHDQVAAREILLHQSQLQGELAEHALEREEKLAKLRDDAAAGKVGTAEYVARRKQIDSQADEADEGSQRRAEAAKIEVNEQRSMSYIRTQGDDESVRAAYIRVDAAKEEARLYDDGTEEQKSSAAAKIDAAETEYYLAQKASDEQKRKEQSELKLAGLRGSAAEMQSQTLAAEAALIEAKQNDSRTRPAEQRQLAIEAARNQQAQSQHSTSVALSSFDTANSLVDASTGTGKGAQSEAARQKFAIESARLAYMQRDPNTAGDAQGIAGQQAKLQQMRREYLEIADARAKSAREAKNELEVTGLQLERMDKVAAAVREQHEFEEKILQARKDGNAELAGSLEKQKQLSLQAQVQQLQREVDDRGKTTVDSLASHAYNQDGATAREIQRLEKRAQRLTDSGHGNDATAKALRRRADSLRESLGPLKDSEKASALLEKQLTKLEAIENNTRTLGKVE